MASGKGCLPPTEDAPPGYDEATGTLDIGQDGLHAQTQARGPLSNIIPLSSHKLTKNQMTDDSTYTLTSLTLALLIKLNKHSWLANK